MPEAGAAPPVPVTILTGFLGAGKTTLVNHILTERHGHRIAVIENEFGEINIDSALVLTTEERIFEFTNGCICCVGAVRTDLVKMLKQLMARREKFDHILVETSGLADPQPVAATFFVDDEVARQVTLDAIVTLVDAKHIGHHLDDPALHGHDNQAVDQIVTADRIVVNKIDLVGAEALAAVETRLRGLNATAEMIRSSYAKVALDRILGVGAFDLGQTMAIAPDFLDDDHHAHDHDASVDSLSFAFDARFDRSRLASFLERLLDARGDDLYRVKGIVGVAGDHRRHVLQAVHRIMELRPANPWGAEAVSSRVVFIGRSLDRAAIESGLRAALVG